MKKTISWLSAGISSFIATYIAKDDQWKTQCWRLVILETHTQCFTLAQIGLKKE